MITAIKILFACVLLTLSLSAMEDDNLDFLLQKQLDTAQAHNNYDMLIFLNALQKAHSDNKYIEIFELNKGFLSLATTLPEPLQTLANEKFNTTNLYL